MHPHSVHRNRPTRAIARRPERLVVTARDAGGQVGVPREWNGDRAAVGDCTVSVASLNSSETKSPNAKTFLPHAKRGGVARRVEGVFDSELDVQHHLHRPTIGVPTLDIFLGVIPGTAIIAVVF
jgi:hypothetical protein